MSSSKPPDSPDFLKSVLDHIKDLPPILRFVLVLIILIIFAVLFNAVIPDNFVPLIYIALIIGVLAYSLWEFQQYKERDAQREREWALEKAKLDQVTELKRLELEDRKDERHHNTPAPPQPSPEQSDQHELQIDYLDWVISQTSRLSLLSVDPQAAGDARDASLNLSSVYTALLTADSEEMENVSRLARPGQERRPVSALAQLDRYDRLVLLGDPGSGKTTFVNFVAMCLAGELLGLGQANLELLTAPLPDDEGKDRDERQPWSLDAPLPLRIILRDFAARGLPGPGKVASERDLWRFVAAELEKAELSTCLPHLQAVFEKGQGLLLLDGLDEVPQAAQQRDQIKQVVESFARQYRYSRILVTSRPYAYQRQNWQLPGFADARLIPFSAGQIRRFVDGWYTHTAILRDTDQNQAARRADDLKKAIFSRPRLYELAERPLLLTLMASLHAWRMGELPQQRQKLYEEAVDLLLDRWERRQKVWDGQQERTHPSLQEYLNTDREKVRKLLDRLAYEAHAAQPADQAGTADIAQEQLISGLLSLTDDPNVKPRQLEVYLRDRAGLLDPRGEGVYAFPHRTFQEYLAACHLTAHHDYPDFLAGLARQDPNRWREVLLLAGAKTTGNEATSIWNLADALCPEPVEPANDPALWGVHLAGQALAETIDPAAPLNERNQKRQKRILDGLIACLGTHLLPARERALAGQSLGALGDPRDNVMTLDKMPFCLIPRGPFYLGESEKQRLNQFDVAYDYWISQHPVSNAQFETFVKAGGYEQKQYWPEAIKAKRWREGKVFNWFTDDYQDKPHDFGSPYNLPNHPVVGVTWYEALAFARWLRGRWHEQGLLPRDWGMILPSEAEWEKAARGGLSVPVTPQIVPPGGWLAETPLKPNDDAQRRYPWPGSADPEKANVKENNVGAPAAPGCFPGGASPYGVQDLSGNVWEWTRSLYDDYPNEPKNLREALNASDTTFRAIRGGAYYEEASSCGVARRGRDYPDRRLDYLGVRVVVSPFFTSDL